ncbi:MAG TPA: STAS domain-containing protein [Solirubrobacteraceae bacterium]|jgi:anti-anti-sigma factor
MGWPDDGLNRDTAKEQIADSADQRLASADLDRHDGTRTGPTSARFDVRRIDHQLGVILVLGGDLDLAAVPLLQERLDLVVRDSGAVVIDLAGLEFIDSSGLEVLVRADRQLRASGGQLILMGGSRAVHRVFELAGVDRYFEWSESPNCGTSAERDRKLGGVVRP